MQSRERMLTSLRHKEPDRVPMDFGGTNFTGIQVTAYDGLKKLLGIKTPTTIVNKRSQLVAVEDAIKDRLHADLDGIGPNPQSCASSMPWPRVAGSSWRRSTTSGRRCRRRTW